MDKQISSSERLLASSAHFEVRSEYECVWLVRKDRGERVVIGDMYGDPECALIDRDEAWCVVAGCGLIVHRLREPFLPFGSEDAAVQLSEFGSEPDDIWWVSAVSQLDKRTVTFTIDANDEHAGVYALDVDSMSIRKLENQT